MRLPLFVALSLIAVPAVAQEAQVRAASQPAATSGERGDLRLGARTQSPSSMLQGLGLAPGQDDLRETIAAAAAHPLGTRENPVRVGGPEGERAYIARLRCANGTSPRVGRRGSAGVGAFGTIVDVYPLDCGAAAPGHVDLVMDMYHEEHREERAPPGFSIVPR